jgi:hypothetical protein
MCNIPNYHSKKYKTISPALVGLICLVKDFSLSIGSFSLGATKSLLKNELNKMFYLLGEYQLCATTKMDPRN